MKLSFLDILEQKIEIPIIQRDYAQGRKANSTIRNNILESFHKALTTDQKLELDFIYASKSGDVIQPLDGQQRLTTITILLAAIRNLLYLVSKDTENYDDTDF